MQYPLKNIITTVLCIACSSLLFAQKLQQDPKLVKGELKNGFKYYLYPADSKSQQTALQLFVNAGSLQENEDQRGLAHFVEHMAFNGSKNFPKNEVITFLESLGVKFGADLNAHTSYDETIYKITIDTKDEQNLNKAISIVADWAFHLSFDSLEIEKERGIVIEEWRTKQGASSRMSDQYLPLIFNNSRYAERKPIGTLDVLHHFRRPTIVNFYTTWYRPQLMGIGIVTNQDLKKTEKLIKEVFGKAKNPKHAPKREAYYLPAHADTLYSILTDKEATTIDFSYVTKIPADKGVRTMEEFESSLKRSFVNNLVKKRFERLSQLQNDFKEGSMSLSDLLLHSGISSGGTTLYEDNIKDGIYKYLLENERIRRYGFTNSEIEDFRTQFVAQIKRGLESRDETVNATGLLADMKNNFFTDATLMDRKYRQETALKVQAAIDSADLVQYLKQSLITGNTVIMLSGPERLKDQLPTKAQLQELFNTIRSAQIPVWKDQISVPDQLLKNTPVAGKITDSTFIKEVGLRKWVLSNGINVYLRPSSGRKDHIQLTGFRKGGIIALDTTDYVNAVYAKNIIGASGAGDFTRQALTKYLLGNSASATFVLSQNREGVAASANMKDIKTMFELLYLKWTQPRADKAVFDNIKKRSVEATQNRKYTPTAEYNKQISRKIGSDDTEASEIDADRLQKELQFDRILDVYHKRFGSARDFEFVIIGDFNPDSIKNDVETYLGGLPGTAIDHTQRIPNYSLKDDSDILMYAGEAEKATVNLFYQTTDLNYSVREIMENTLMEEVLKVKLRKNLREEQSGVYGVGVSTSATSFPTPLMRTRVTFTCEPARTDFLIGQVGVELDKIAKDPSYFKEELANIKVQLKQDYKKQYEKETFWSAELRNHLYYNFSNWDYFTKYDELLDNITGSDISNRIKSKVIGASRVKAILLPETNK